MAWLSARSKDGTFLWRVEDLDGPRTIEGIEDRQIEDLSWLGLDWDAGPVSSHSRQENSGLKDSNLEVGPHRQSERDHLYREALHKLAARDLLFPCELSRKDLREVASAPHNAEASPYPRHLRPNLQQLPENWFRDLLADPHPPASIRFKVGDGDGDSEVIFHDGVYGDYREDVGLTTGDFVVRRRDGLWAYQLAVVVDDAQQGVTEVVRGSDLLSSTPRQILLQRALGLPTPEYIHVPVVNNRAGDKLSKRNQGLTLRTLRQQGWKAEAIVAELALSLGLVEEAVPLRPVDLLEHYSLQKLPRQESEIPSRFL